MRTNNAHPVRSASESRLRRSVRWRLAIVAAVVVACVWVIYPPKETIKLGLDLNGGVHLVLRVKTDTALRRETETTVERLKSVATEKQISFARMEVTGPAEFRVDGIADGAAFREASADVGRTFERTMGEGAYIFRMRPEAARAIASDTIRQAIATVDRRVNALGVADAVVARYIEDDQILVELPGVADVERAKQIIKSTSQLRLTLVERGPFPSREAALQSYAGVLPAEMDLIASDAAHTTSSGFYVVRKAAAVAGNDLRDARPSADEFNGPSVHFTLKPDAARRFGDFTERNINRTLATVLDNRVTAVATIISRIDDQGQITGLSRDEMIEQVITFQSGALPADMEYVEERTIGASLGAASIRSGLAASIGGLTLVTLFMLGYYRVAGLNAFASIALNLLILVALVAYVPIAMTLPGIAGLILTIGMGVDSNVLVFERIKEELAGEKNPRAAVRAGFDRVWITIVDTHVTSLIAAAFLHQFGTTAIRGFATTLTIGLLANVFTAVFVSRTLFEVMLRSRRIADRVSRISRSVAHRGRAAFDFMRWSPLAIVFSLVVIGAGAVTMVVRPLPLGIDFSGGTMVVVEFPRDTVTDEDVRAAIAPLPGDEVVQRYGPASDRRFMVHLPLAGPHDHS